jgi:uncharacterized membrane protein YjdF
LALITLHQVIFIVGVQYTYPKLARKTWAAAAAAAAGITGLLPT